MCGKWHPGGIFGGGGGGGGGGGWLLVGMAKGYKLLVTSKKIFFLCSYFSDDRRGKWDKGQKIQLTRDQNKIFLAGV